MPTTNPAAAFAANDTTPARLSLSTAERAAVIRKALKAAGIGPKAVRVRTREGSLDSSISVRVKAAIGLARVRSIVAACGMETVRYDANGCGDILGGGNTFVFVDRVIGDEDESSTLRAAVLNALAASAHIGVASFGGMQAVKANKYDWHIAGPMGEDLRAYGDDSCARVMVEAWLDAQDAVPAQAVS